jgi:hypothetical protein
MRGIVAHVQVRGSEDGRLIGLRVARVIRLDADKLSVSGQTLGSTTSRLVLVSKRIGRLHNLPTSSASLALG